MKQEIMPEIPNEQFSASSSMYEQLKKTSQKWFTRSQKRIFDVGCGQRLQASNHFSSLEESLRAGVGSGNQDKSRLMEVMREQIQIVCQQFAMKTKNIMLEQTKKIKVLGDLLMKNEAELNTKNRVLDQIANSLKNFRQNKQDPKGKQWRNVQNRIQSLQNRFDQIQTLLRNSNPNNHITKIQNKIKQTLSSLSTDYMGRLQEIHFDLDDRIDRVDKLNHLNHSMNTSICSPKTTNKDYVQMQKRMATIQTQLQDMKDQLDSFKNKRYSYENYKVEQIQIKMSQIHDQIIHLERLKSNSKQNTHSCSQKLKSSQTTQLTSTGHLLQQSSKSRFINRYKSLINNRKIRVESHSSDHSEHSSESEVQETIVNYEKSNVERFIRMVNESRIQKPVLIEVDQTGYVRSVDTGMYLVDQTGNGFQLSDHELNYLKTRGAIQI